MPKANTVVFGNFIEPDQGDMIGRLTLSFQSGTLDIDELWESSSISAKFLSTFWGKFFPLHDYASSERRRRIEDEVHFISGELLGNAVKFSYKPEYFIEICLYLHEEELRFYVINIVNPNEKVKFQEFIQKILNENPEEFFLEQLEKNADQSVMESGIGYLTILKDYHANLSWKFEETTPEKVTVTVMARLPIIRY